MPAAVSYTHLDVYKRQYYIWAADKAGNISAAEKVNVTALDIVPPVVVKVETQPTWDATEMCIRDRDKACGRFYGKRIYAVIP